MTALVVSLDALPVSVLSTSEPMPTDLDGPFPARVWLHVGGEVVGYATVTGESHHPDQIGATCWTEDVDDPTAEPTYCRPGAGPDSWHTPVSEVVRLADPIPWGQPKICTYCGMSDEQASMHTLHVQMCEESGYAPVWWPASGDLTRRLANAEVTA